MELGRQEYSEICMTPEAARELLMAISSCWSYNSTTLIPAGEYLPAVPAGLMFKELSCPVSAEEYCRSKLIEISSHAAAGLSDQDDVVAMNPSPQYPLDHSLQLIAGHSSTAAGVDSTTAVVLEGDVGGGGAAREYYRSKLISISLYPEESPADVDF